MWARWVRQSGRPFGHLHDCIAGELQGNESLGILGASDPFSSLPPHVPPVHAHHSAAPLLCWPIDLCIPLLSITHSFTPRPTHPLCWPCHSFTLGCSSLVWLFACFSYLSFQLKSRSDLGRFPSQLGNESQVPPPSVPALIWIAILHPPAAPGYLPEDQIRRPAARHLSLSTCASLVNQKASIASPIEIIL